MSENKKKLSQYVETTLDKFQASANTFIPGFQTDTCNCKINSNITINDAMGIGCIIKVFDEVWDIDTYNRNYRQ